MRSFSTFSPSERQSWIVFGIAASIRLSSGENNPLLRCGKGKREQQQRRSAEKEKNFEDFHGISYRYRKKVIEMAESGHWIQAIWNCASTCFLRWLRPVKTKMVLQHPFHGFIKDDVRLVSLYKGVDVFYLCEGDQVYLFKGMPIIVQCALL